MQACHNFEIGGDTIKTMKTVHGWQCQCMQTSKDIFPIRKQIYGNLLLFVAFLYFKSVANLFYSRVNKHFPSSRGFRNSVCVIINHEHAYEVKSILANQYSQKYCSRSLSNKEPLYIFMSHNTLCANFS